MKFSEISVFVPSVIIKHSIRQIGIFLYFSDQCSCANCMHRTGLNKKHIILMYFYFLKILFYRPLLQTAPELFLIHIMIKSIYQLCILRCIQHIPHLRLTKQLMLHFPCISIIRMYLHRQVLFSVNKLDQYRKLSLLQIRIR